MWGVGILFTVGVIVAIGSIVAGRIFNMPHASKAGIVGIFVVLLAAIAFVVAPGIVDSILGNGCI
jgi:predicted MFS family arabinose efflux permease